MKEILSVNNIKVHFKHLLEEPVKAVDDVSFTVVDGENFGIIGETGSGKTTISNLITGLLGSWNKRGNIKFLYRDGLVDVEKIPSPYLRSHLQMVFQDSGLALNPRLKIGENLEEVYRINYKKIDFRKNIESLIHEVGLSGGILNKFPSDLSGGMKRRVFLARSFAALAYLPEDVSDNADNPKLLILDEITLGLDVPLQNKIMNFLLNVQKKLALTYLVISHDLNIISLLCKNVIVLHRGRLVESMEKTCLSGNSRALHPYTNLLLDSYHGKPITIPEKDIDAIGNILLEGCRSRDVCAERYEACFKIIPGLERVSDSEKPEVDACDATHLVACHKYKRN